MRAIRVAAAAVALLLAGSAHAWSQQPTQVISADELDSAVIGHAEAMDRERERIRSLLERAEVRDIARDHGIDLNRVEAGVGTLGAPGLHRLAPNVRTVEAALKQDGGISFSTTALILLLLLVLAIVIAV